MKIKIRQDDISSAEINDWHEMNDWIAELRDDSRAEPAGDSRAEPVGDGSPTPESAAVAPPADWFIASAETSACADMTARAGVAEVTARAGVAEMTACAGVAEMTACAGVTERAVIGDQLRIPIAWCEMGSCISHHGDPAALGEADIHARAILAGWRVDALDRLACPQCQQRSPAFRASCPVTLWDRDTAIASAHLMTAVMRNHRTAGSAARRPTGAIPAPQPAAIHHQPPDPGLHHEYRSRYDAARPADALNRSQHTIPAARFAEVCTRPDGPYTQATGAA